MYAFCQKLHLHKISLLVTVIPGLDPESRIHPFMITRLHTLDSGSKPGMTLPTDFLKENVL